MPRRPLHQLDPVPVRVGEPRGSRTERPRRMLLRFRPQTLLRQCCDGGGEVADLDDEVAEPGPDDDRSVRGPVDQFEGDDLVAGQLEHGQALTLAGANMLDLSVAEGGVEVEGDPEDAHPVGRVEGVDRTGWPGHHRTA